MSLDGQYDDDNIFAKILRGEIPNVTVYEDKNTLAFMDVFPQTKGHVLVIHKHEKARTILDISAQGLSEVTQTVQHVTKAVNLALTPDGIKIMQFNGAAAGQTVFHLHMHILPRYQNASQKPHASGAMANMDILNALAQRIKAAL